MVAMKRSEYERLLVGHIKWLESELSGARKTATKDGFEKELALEAKLEETRGALWNSKALSAGDESREQAAQQMATEERAIELASDLEPATTTDIDERLERYRRQYEAESYGISVEQMEKAYSKIGVK